MPMQMIVSVASMHLDTKQKPEMLEYSENELQYQQQNTNHYMS